MNWMSLFRVLRTLAHAPWKSNENSYEIGNLSTEVHRVCLILNSGSRVMTKTTEEENERKKEAYELS